MLKRTMDAAFLNEVANNPDVRPFLGGSGTLDLTPQINDPANIALVGEFGGFIVMRLGPGLYECHSIFLPDGRGQKAVEASEQGLRYCFTQTDCTEMVTKVPEGNAAALGLTRHMGFTKSFQCAQTWPLEDGTRGGCGYFTLAFAKWAQRDAECLRAGQWFHNRLEELTAEYGKTIPAHFEETAHNCAVGASVLMFRAGNSMKAVNTYNTWAAIAMFPPISLKSLTPVILDMDQVIVTMNGNDMEILSCR